MTILTSAQIDALLRGASLLACGGGLKFAEQKRLVKGKKVKLISPDELNADDWCATVSEVGAAAAPVMDKSRLPAAVKLLEQKTGKKISALIPPEIGQEAIVIDASSIVDLPIVDADLAGGRAVPRLNDMALVTRGVKFTISPAVVLTASDKTLFIPQQNSLEADENQVRQLVPKNQVITLVGGLITAKTIGQKLNDHSYTRAVKLGEALQSGKPLTRILPTSLLLGPIKVKIAAIKTLSSQGFDSKIVNLISAGGTIRLKVENEYMKLITRQQKFAFPQLIIIFDRITGRGVHSSELNSGNAYNLIVAEAFRL